MSDLDFDKILALATRFRAAILAILQFDQNALSVSFKCFPRGACSDTSDLLAKYFQSQECGQFLYVTAYDGDESHVWLEQDELIVDITASQFGGASIIVTFDHSWHRRFKVRSKHIADFDAERSQRHRLWNLYGIILKEMDKSPHFSPRN